MDFDPWHHWLWLRPLFILALVGVFVALAVVIDWFKRRREKRAPQAPMAAAARDGREMRVVERDSGDEVKSHWRGPTATSGTQSTPPRRVASSRR